MVELGLIPSLDVAKTEYTTYIRNGLITQLTRIQPGNDIEEAHMRDRQLISKWCYEKGQADNIISMVEKEGNTYAVVNDYFKLRNLFGSLLKEVQRIKSEGDYEAGKELVEKYGVKADRKLNEEVLARHEKLKLAPYSGFINPKYTPVYENGAIADIKIGYPDDYVKQMLYYSENYSFLPDYN
jgi:dipeptidyl-peptidase III